MDKFFLPADQRRQTLIQNTLYKYTNYPEWIARVGVSVGFVRQAGAMATAFLLLCALDRDRETVERLFPSPARSRIDSTV